MGFSGGESALTPGHGGYTMPPKYATYHRTLGLRTTAVRNMQITIYVHSRTKLLMTISCTTSASGQKSDSCVEL